MWQNKLNGILGLCVISLADLGFSDSLHRILLVLTGVFIAVVAFWGNSLIMSNKELTERSKENETSCRPDL
jgi:hypothetical protein